METSEKVKGTNENARTQFCDNTICWLAKHLKTDDQTIKKILIGSNARLFLLVWPVFEQEIFNGNITLYSGSGKPKSEKKALITAVEEFKDYYSELNIDDVARYLHSRYQDQGKYNRLKHDSDYSRVGDILKTPYNKIKNDQKLEMLFYVVYRYRNNIFHGNKELIHWDDFEEQIRFCLEFMMKIISINDKYKIVAR